MAGRADDLDLRGVDLVGEVIALAEIIFAQKNLHGDTALARRLELHAPQRLSAPFAPTFIDFRKMLVPAQSIHRNTKRRRDFSLRTLNVRQLLDHFKIDVLFGATEFGFAGGHVVNAGSGPRSPISIVSPEIS